MIKTIKRFKILIIVVIILLFFVFIFSQGANFTPDEVEYGVTFSKKQAESLGFDWQYLYTEILDDLGVKKLRLAAYWDEIEPNNNEYEWEDLDWQIREAGKRGAEIILAVGSRLPRWPECHIPSWSEELPKEKREEETLEYIEEVVKHYKDYEDIKTWQIENEPFLAHFGDCPDFDPKFLDDEIELVRNLDKRPLVITDSGELSTWIPAAKRADIFGTTMYRDTYSKVLKRYVHYPIEPGFFHFKRNIAKLFSSPEDWIVIELQAEPWGPRPFQELSQEERDKTMDLEKFIDIIEFSRQTGFRQFYLWGVEWWYWEKTVNNNPELWDEARKLFFN